MVVFIAEDEEILFFAFGADDVGPPRALDEAVADAYDPAARLLLRCCLDNLPLTLFSLEEEEDVASADSESLPLDEEEEEEPLLLSPLFDDDDDRGMVTAASLRILLILLLVFILE